MSKAFRKMSKQMSKNTRVVSSLFMLITLLAFSQNSLSQIGSADGDILDFMPAIIAGINKNNVVQPPSPPVPPKPPVTGSGNYRIVKTEAFRRMNPKGKISTSKVTWNSAGNISNNEVKSFDLFNGNPSAVTQTITANTTYNTKNQPLTESALIIFRNGTSTTQTKVYNYSGNGSLRSTTTNTNNPNQIVNSTIEFKYTSNKLTSAKVTTKVNGVTNNTELHSLSYDNKQRVKTQRIVTTTISNNTKKERMITHQYNNAGHLIETVSVYPSFKHIETYLPFTGNTKTIKSVFIDRQTNVVNGRSDIVTTYAAGACNLRGPKDPLVIEGNITATTPYSPNIGCIKR